MWPPSLSSAKHLRGWEPLRGVHTRQQGWDVLFLYPGGAGPLTKVLPEDVSITLGRQSEALGRQAGGWRSSHHPGTLGKGDEVISIFLYLHDWTGRLDCLLIDAGRIMENESFTHIMAGGMTPVADPFNSSSPGRSRALLRAARARPSACARPSVLRPSLAPQLALPRRAPAAGAAPAAAPGRESAARRPGTRQGAGAAPNRPGFSPSPISRFSESCPFTLCRAAPGTLPRRAFPPQPQLVWPGPKCRMGLPLRGPVAARTDTAPLVWGQDDS